MFISSSEGDLVDNPQNFWKFIKRTRREANIPNCMSYNDRIAIGGSRVCSLFAEFFESVYSGNTNTFSGTYSARSFTAETISAPYISYVDISNSIESLKSDTSRGPDGLPSVFLKNCSNNLLAPLHIIFNNCIRCGGFPSWWKLSSVTPIYKSGPRTDISNYRPISINNNFSKVFDAILAKILTAHVENYIIHEQHGFTTGKSTETNLLIFTDYINNSVEGGLFVDCIYTDIKKAFDRVPIDLLIFKLRELYGIQDPLLSCIGAFLCGRSQQVSLNGSTSLFFSVPSGVGQGTHLGPILFLLFINDLKSVIKHSQFLLFADDCKLFKSISNISDQYTLQQDIDLFVEWCGRNQLELNIDKCKHMSFSRQLNPTNFNYHIGGNRIEIVTCMKDLGVYMDRKLSYRYHVDHIVTKANKLLGFISRTTRSFSNLRSIYMLFVALVRPVLEYCSVIWAPTYQIHIDRIEKVQKKFVKLLCYRFNVAYSSDYYPHLLSFFSLQHLNTRRKFVDIMFAFKVINHIIKCPEIEHLFPLYTAVRPLRQHPLLAVEFHSTNYGIHSSVTRISNAVNSVGVRSQMLGASLISFKSALRSSLYE